MAYEDRYKSLIEASRPNAVGHRIRVLRTSWEMSQSEMARHLYIKSQTISQIEGGLSRPSTEVEVRLKAAFHVTIDWIRFGETAGLSQPVSQRLEEAAQWVSMDEKRESTAKRASPVKSINPKRPARRPPEK